MFPLIMLMLLMYKLKYSRNVNNREKNYERNSSKVYCNCFILIIVFDNLKSILNMFIFI